MTDPKVFYNKEDYWEIPSEIYGDRKSPLNLLYLVSLPGRRSLNTYI